jgi:hypothetical protein
MLSKEEEDKVNEYRCKATSGAAREMSSLLGHYRVVTEVNEVNVEATNAISKADFKSKSYIALKEARESLYWLELLHRNNYLTDVQFNSLYADAEELVKILVARCKRLDSELLKERNNSAFRHKPSAFVKSLIKRKGSIT